LEENKGKTAKSIRYEAVYYPLLLWLSLVVASEQADFFLNNSFITLRAGIKVLPLANIHS
jgi:hypothetical protein